MFAGSQTGVLIRAAALASERKAGEPFHFGNLSQNAHSRDYQRVADSLKRFLHWPMDQGEVDFIGVVSDP